MKLSEIEYKRPDKDEVIKELISITEKFAAAPNAEEQLELYNRYTSVQENLGTMASLAYIRFTLDTEDEFYVAENDYYDENFPVFEKYGVEFMKKMLSSPFRPQLEKKLSPLIFKNYEIALKSFSDSIITEMQEENRLSTEYKKLLSSARIEFNGEKLNIPQLGKYKESLDRDIRKSAFSAQGLWMEQNSAQFDDIFDKMVRVRTEAAQKMGYKNYVELGYYKMGRNCYSQNDIASFREQVLKSWVPFVCEIKKKQAKDLGVDKLMLYDDTIWLKNGNPEPIGTPEKIFENGREMYEDMSGATGKFINFMLEHELFDVLARPKKSGGGYCTELSSFKMPFIFANFNGTYGDVDVLTHEAGHAYASYEAMNNIPLSELRQGGMETCEVHSMSMEFFAWKYMNKFFGDRADDYRYMHLSNAVSFIPYGTMVDYFQQLVYENYDMTPKMRNDLWLELENSFRPYLSSIGIEYIEKGTRWQYQSHIFERPFYYIDYCLAQYVSFCFLEQMHKDYKTAFDNYTEFLKKGGSKTFVELVKDAGFASPFETGSLENLAVNLKKLFYR